MIRRRRRDRMFRKEKKKINCNKYVNKETLLYYYQKLSFAFFEFPPTQLVLSDKITEHVTTNISILIVPSLTFRI